MSKDITGGQEGIWGEWKSRATPESKKGSSKVNFPSRQWFSKVKTADIREFTPSKALAWNEFTPSKALAWRVLYAGGSLCIWAHRLDESVFSATRLTGLCHEPIMSSSAYAVNQTGCPIP